MTCSHVSHVDQISRLIIRLAQARTSSHLRAEATALVERMRANARRMGEIERGCFPADVVELLAYRGCTACEAWDGSEEYRALTGQMEIDAARADAIARKEL